MNTPPIAWTIAGSDSGGGAGIQADLKTFEYFNVHGGTAITALTAQNRNGVFDIQTTPTEHLDKTLHALKDDLLPQAIKLGMLACPDNIKIIAQHLHTLNMPVIMDPVLVATSGDKLFKNCLIEAYKKDLLPLATLITPNVSEATALTGINIHSFDDMARAAKQLLKLGAKAVLLKGGDLNGTELASDYYCDETQSFWINQNRVDARSTHGTGCTLSAAIAANLAQGWSLIDAIIIAKSHVHAALTQSTTLALGLDKNLSAHFPWITTHPQCLPEPYAPVKDIGPYPIVNNLSDLKAVCMQGIRFVQLRIKNKPGDFENLCEQAKNITETYRVDLIINDDLQAACQYQGGLHLGQEDLAIANLNIFPKNQILGLSAHNLYELAKAYAYNPSYLAMGPIFNTTSKQLAYPQIGLKRLTQIAALSPKPLTAIGGISYQLFSNILKTGCSGVAFIHAIRDFIHDGRYQRQLALPDFDQTSLARLMHANIVCVGAGGLAAGFLPLLVGAGIGSITIIDGDTVGASNLHRQVFYTTDDIGRPKVTVMKNRLQALNPNCDIHIIQETLTLENAQSYLSGFDLIIDGTDNFDSHYLINDMAVYLNTPLIAASVLYEKGHVFAISPGRGCYRCIFPEKPSKLEAPTCRDAGVWGYVPGLIGMLQAKLAIDQLLKLSQPSCFSVIDLQAFTLKSYKLTPAKPCPACNPRLSLNTLYRMNSMKAKFGEISPASLNEALAISKEINLLDVREDHEREAFNIGGQHIPIQDLPERIFELDAKSPLIVYCRSGGRSAMACEFLANQGFDVKNLKGGMLAWQSLISADE